jgi:hypothetical protein
MLNILVAYLVAIGIYFNLFFHLLGAIDNLIPNCWAYLSYIGKFMRV